MKRITYAGVSLVTGDSVTAALQEYTTLLSPGTGSVTVEIPVLEANGSLSTHTLLIGPGLELDATDAEALTDRDEEDLFPAPELPQVVQIAADQPSAEAEERARELDQAISDIETSWDEGLS